jgi:hypothetical protein
MFGTLSFALFLSFSLSFFFPLCPPGQKVGGKKNTPPIHFIISQLLSETYYYRHLPAQQRNADLVGSRLWLQAKERAF